MAIDLIDADATESPPFPVKRFTLEEYRRLRDSDIVSDWPRFELLEGWIVPKMTKGPEHDAVVQMLQDWLSQHLPPQWKVRVQSAIEAVESEPEPDIAIVRGPAANYLTHHPTGDEILLIVEVAESSLAKDRQKARIYSATGVRHYWIVNLLDRQVEVFRNPLTGGAGYQDQHIAFADESLDVAIDAQHVLTMPVSEMLPIIDPD